MLSSAYSCCTIGCQRCNHLCAGVQVLYYRLSKMYHLCADAVRYQCQVAASACSCAGCLAEGKLTRT